MHRVARRLKQTGYQCCGLGGNQAAMQVKTERMLLTYLCLVMKTYAAPARSTTPARTPITIPAMAPPLRSLLLLADSAVCVLVLQSHDNWSEY